MIVPSIMSDEEVVGTPAPGWQLGRRRRSRPEMRGNVAGASCSEKFRQVKYQRGTQSQRRGTGGDRSRARLARRHR